MASGKLILQAIKNLLDDSPKPRTKELISELDQLQRSVAGDPIPSRINPQGMSIGADIQTGRPAPPGERGAIGFKKSKGEIDASRSPLTPDDILPNPRKDLKAGTKLDLEGRQIDEGIDNVTMIDLEARVQQRIDDLKDAFGGQKARGDITKKVQDLQLRKEDAVRNRDTGDLEKMIDEFDAPLESDIERSAIQTEEFFPHTSKAQKDRIEAGQPKSLKDKPTKSDKNDDFVPALPKRPGIPDRGNVNLLELQLRNLRGNK